MAIKTVYESGTTYDHSDCSVFVPDSIENPDEVASRTRSLTEPTEDATRLESDRDDLRSSSERIELLALLKNRGGEWRFEHTDVGPQQPRVPVRLVTEGKAAVAAYLACHGLNNDEIADHLDVGRRTVSQYIADFKQGDR